MARPRLNEEKVILAGIDIIDQRGLEALSIVALAKHLKVKPPSLYNHIESLDALEALMALRGLREITKGLERAAMGLAGFDALKAVAEHYRMFAKEQPGLYRLTARSYEEENDERKAAGRETLDVFLAILKAYDLQGDEALHAVRFMRSSLHGFVSLEISQGFGLPLDLEESFARLLSYLDLSLRTGLRSNVR